MHTQLDQVTIQSANKKTSMLLPWVVRLPAGSRQNQGSGRSARALETSAYQICALWRIAHWARCRHASTSHVMNSTRTAYECCCQDDPGNACRLCFQDASPSKHGEEVHFKLRGTCETVCSAKSS
jgi:hypothetical protein